MSETGNKFQIGLEYSLQYNDKGTTALQEDLDKINNALAESAEKITTFEQAIAKFGKKKIGVSDEVSKLNTELEQAKKELDDLRKKYSEFANIASNSSKNFKASKGGKNYFFNTEEQLKSFKDLEQKLTSHFNSLVVKKNKFVESLGELNVDKSLTDKLSNIFDNINIGSVDNIPNELDRIRSAWLEFYNSFKTAGINNSDIKNQMASIKKELDSFNNDRNDLFKTVLPDSSIKEIEKFEQNVDSIKTKIKQAKIENTIFDSEEYNKVNQYILSVASSLEGIKNNFSGIQTALSSFTKSYNELNTNNQGTDNNKLDELKTDLGKVEKLINDVNDNIAKVAPEIKLDLSTVKEQIQEVETLIGSIKLEVPEGAFNFTDDKILAAIKELNTSLETLNKTTKKILENFNTFSTEAISGLKDVAKVQNDVTDATEKTQKAYEDTITSVKQVNSAEEVRHNNKRSNVSQEEADVENQFKQEKELIRQLTAEYRTAYSNRKKAFSEMSKYFYNMNKDLSQQLVNNLTNFIGIRALGNQLEDVSRQVIDIQYNTINNQRLMGDWSTELRDKLSDSASETARATGILVTDAQEIQGAWIRINDVYAENFDLLSGITKLTSEFMNVGEIEDAEEAVKLVNATMLQFNLITNDTTETLKNAKTVLNEFAYLADKTAMGTADEYGAALAKFGGVLNNVNGEVEDGIVLSSILADRLAKSGEEAGTSLKTFVTYLTRSKTTSLFDDLSVSLDDTNLKLYDAKGQLKEFDEIMNIVSGTYQKFKNEGNDIMANSILEAVGATRQRDTATAILSSWNTDKDKYYNMIGESNDSDYLAEQNARLMESFKNQWNALVVDMQSAAMNIGNSGLIDFLTKVMQGMGSLFNMVSKVNPSLLTFATYLSAKKLGATLFDKFGHYTGLTEKLWAVTKQGTAAQREHVLQTRDETSALFEKYKNTMLNTTVTKENSNAIMLLRTNMTDLETSLGNITTQYNNGTLSAEAYEKALKDLQNSEKVDGVKDAVATIEAKKNALDECNFAYKNGIIDIDQYNKAMEKIHSIEKTEELNRETKVIKDKNDALRKTTVTVKQNTAEEKKRYDYSKLSFKDLTKEYILQKAKETQLKVNTKTIKTNTTAKNANTSATELSTVKERISIITDKLKEKSLYGISTAATFASKALSMLSIGINWAMGIFTVGSLILDVFGGKSESTADKIENLKNEIEETQSQIDNLNKSMSESSSTETEKELNLLNEQLKVKKEMLSINERKQNQTEVFGTWNPLDASIERDYLGEMVKYSDASTSIKSLQKDILDLEKQFKNTSDVMERNEILKNISDKRVEITNLNGDIVQLTDTFMTYSDKIKTGLDNNWYDGKQQEQARSMLEKINTLLEDIGENKEKLASYSNDISGMLFTEEDLIADLDTVLDGNAAIDDYISKLNDGTASAKDLYEISKLLGTEVGHNADSFGIAAQKLESIKSKNIDDYYNEIQADIENTTSKIKEFENEISKLKVDPVLNSEAINDYNDKINKLKVQLNELEKFQNISINLQFTGFEGFASSVQDLVSSTNDLVSAQAQLAEGTALTKNQLFDLAMTYPQMLQQANIFTDGSVASHQNMINSILDMENQKYNKQIDLYIAELQADNALIQAQMDIESQKLTKVAEIEAQFSEDKVANEAAVVQALAELKMLDGINFAEQKDGELVVNQDAKQKLLEQGNDWGAKETSILEAVGINTEKALTDGARYGVNGQNMNLGVAAANVSKYIGSVLVNLQKSTQNAIAGDGSISSGAYGGSNGTSTSGMSLKWSSKDQTIDGKHVNDFAATMRQAISSFQSSLRNQYQANLNAITNLENLKLLGLSGVSSSGAGNSSSGGSGGSGNKATDKNTDATEDLTKAIEDMTNTFIKNVESLQDRIAKALKKKYEEQYDERKKLLEKEHNERVEQIQAEIDAINGERPVDKKSKLAQLQEKLEKWKRDDSTLGKQKQKEYMDQISELEKEIKLDELEQKMDEENQNYENSIDQDSEFYDAILKKLDEQMTDEQLYREANDMIRNLKTQEIIDLLSKYDENWSGWATLMGQTSGEIIAEEVKNALNNYLDVVKGTVTATGGQHSGSSGSSSSSSSNKGSSSSSNSGWKAVETVYNGTTLWDLAVKYYGNGLLWTKIQNANGGVDPRRLNVGSKLYIPFKTGGETGNDEGLAYLHKKERVLTDEQTKAFNKLVYDILPSIDTQSITNSSHTINNNQTIFEKELMTVKVDKVINETKFDERNSQENLSKLIEKSLKRSGVNFKR